MASQAATELAHHIVNDLKGAGYYRDPNILTDYLSSRVDGGSDEASKLTRQIIDDLKGAKYYMIPTVLAGLLDGRVKKPEAKAPTRSRSGRRGGECDH